MACEVAENKGPKSPQRDANSVRFPCLDGVRGTAALLVVVFHASAILQRGPSANHLNRILTLAISGFGDIAVAVFFSLSGFLLFNEFVLDLIDQRGRKPLRRYFSRRFLRIYPAYWAALIASELILGPLVGDRFGLFSLTGRYSDSTHMFLGLSVAWTLAVEVGFYCFLPFFSIVLGMFTRNIRSRKMRVAIVAGACGMLLVVPRIYSLVVLSRFESDFRFHMSLFQYLDWFGFGMILCVVSTLLRLGWHPKSGFFGIATSRVLCWPLALVLYLVATLQVGYDGSSVTSFRASTEFAHVVIGLSTLFVLIPVTIGRRAMTEDGLLSSKPMLEIGLVSYGVYLWHDIFFKYFITHYSHGTGVGPFCLVLVVLIPISLVAGWLSHRFIERPSMKLSW
jgi:peptidoglycan/LPS O-acetylase OafA/YrhL